MKKMMTMMALMVFAVSGFAVKYNAKDVPTDPQKKYEYWKSVESKSVEINCKRLFNMISHDKKLSDAKVILATATKMLNASNISSDILRQIIADKITAYYLYKTEQHDTVVLLTMNSQNKKYIALSYYFLNDLEKAYPLLIQEKLFSHAIICISKMNKNGNTETLLISLIKDPSLKKINSKLVLRLVSVIKSMPSLTVENNVKKLNMLLSLSEKFPPLEMEVGTEIEWAKCDIYIKNSIENLQKIIKIKLEIERALNE